MLGKLKIEKTVDDLSFSSTYEFKGDEYLKALQAYAGFDLDTMMGKKEVELSSEKEKKPTVKEKEIDYLSCDCDVIDKNNKVSLDCNEFFNIFFSKENEKYMTLALNYETMDNDFEEDIQEWIYESSRLLKKAVGVFGVGLLPKRDFYFEFTNYSGDKITVLFYNAYLVSKDSNLITIGVEDMKLID